MGEGFETDKLIMPYISSANIACGAHAGDANTIKKTIELASKYGVLIGAHPSYPDRENFGRKEMDMEPEQVYEIVLNQILFLKDIADRMGEKLHHVKPHGALYNTAAKDPQVASAIAKAISYVDKSLLLYGLPNSEFEKAALDEGLAFYCEIFSDRTYTDSGSLTPRSEKNALISTADDALAQVLQILKKGTLRSTSGNLISVRADTICIHGDGEHAVEFAKKIKQGLLENNILISASK